MRFYLNYFFIFLATCQFAYAASENKKTPPENPFSNVKFIGYVDASYNYLYRSNQFNDGIISRVNDTNQNGVSLQQAALTITLNPDQGFGWLVDMILGQDAFILAPFGMNPNVFDAQAVGFTVPQAYIQYKKNAEFFQLGEMQTIAGFEQYYYPENLNFSFSILSSYAQPGEHLGIRDMHTINNQYSVVVGVGNDWNSIMSPYKQNNIELGLNYTDNNKWSWLVDTYSGYSYIQSLGTSGPTSWRSLFDVVGTFSATEKITFVVNYDYAYQNQALIADGRITRAVWQGIAGYVGYEINDKWRTALRGEIFADPQGFRTGVAQTWNEVTLSLAYHPLKDLQCRIETRRDFSNTNAFLNKNRETSANNQQSFAFDVLYQFS